MTYAEANNRPPFDWNVFLEKESHTDEELIEARQLSREWVTCACGNQCASIPRNDEGVPIDIKLRYLGYAFTHHVCNLRIGSNKKEAIETLKQIEERSQFLINQMKKP